MKYEKTTERQLGKGNVEVHTISWETTGEEDQDTFPEPPKEFKDAVEKLEDRGAKMRLTLRVEVLP
jgi:hypothetical protein